MHTTIAPLLLLALLAAEDQPKPKFPLGKETSYVEGPLDAEGYVDYEAALNDRLGKGIKPEKNANALLWKNVFGPKPQGATMPAAYFRRLGIDKPPKDGPYFRDLHSYLREVAKLDFGEFRPPDDQQGRFDEVRAIDDQQSRASQRPWKAKDYPHIAGWLKANEKPLARAVEATRLPDYYNPLVTRRGEGKQETFVSILMPNVQTCRQLAAALSARAMLRVAEGDFDAAWQDLIACHRLGRLVARGGTLIEGLVGIAIDHIASNTDLAYLERAKLASKQIRERLKELQNLPPLPSMADKIDLTERFLYLDTLQFIHRYGPAALEEQGAWPGMKPGAAQLRFLTPGDWEPALRNGNRWYNRIVAAMRLKERDRREKELDKIEKELRQLRAESTPDTVGKFLGTMFASGKTVGKRVGDVMLTLLLPAFRKVHQAENRAEQLQRNLHVAFALAAYHRDHGRYPERLDALAPGYLPAVPGDLFSGKALIYRPAAGGYLLYSVGVNGKDEGGHWTEDDPPGDDPRVRMPLPELKGRR